MMKPARKIAALIVVFLLVASCSVSKQEPLLTRLEESGYAHLTSSAEITVFLTELSNRNPTAERVTIARSALGSPVEALLISSEIDRFKSGHCSSDKVTAMLIGSQHGMEPSGAEALLLISRDIVEGQLAAWLEDMNFVIIPNGNPDGRNSKRRVNGNGANLSTNFTILSETETRGILDALHKWKPEVVLDVHESAVLKKRSLGRQGYLTDFEAQFEAANNPNVDGQIRAFSFNHLLPEVIELVNSGGLPAQRYIGEITSIHQPITHGGLSLRNLRNMAGIMGSFSFLLENRLDPSSGNYPTDRNICARVAKQYLCIWAFLTCSRAHQSEIMKLSRNARMRWTRGEDEEPLYLFYAYAADRNRPQITLPLRKRETRELVKHTFEYRGAVEYHSPLRVPAYYIVTQHQDLIKDFLDRHHIAYETAEQPVKVVVQIQYNLPQQGPRTGPQEGYTHYVVPERVSRYELKRGDIIISLDQPARRLIPLLLEPQSLSSVFNSQEYRHIVQTDSDFFVYRVPHPGLRNALGDEPKLPSCENIFKDFLRSDPQEEEIIRVLGRRKVIEETGIGKCGKSILPLTQLTTTSPLTKDLGGAI
ncbi:MAG: M14 family metallocarboxypeptidase [Deltaproteobacteria bacterium]|nr:MAG: M14 family metallocarboxypeptidase [Deltaproteobacteria bacterium]